MITTTPRKLDDERIAFIYNSINFCFPSFISIQKYNIKWSSFVTEAEILQIYEKQINFYYTLWWRLACDRKALFAHCNPFWKKIETCFNSKSEISIFNVSFLKKAKQWFFPNKKLMTSHRFWKFLTPFGIDVIYERPLTEFIITVFVRFSGLFCSSTKLVRNGTNFLRNLQIRSTENEVTLSRLVQLNCGLLPRVISYVFYLLKPTLWRHMFPWSSLI